MPGRIFLFLLKMDTYEKNHVWTADVTNVTIKGLQFLNVFNLSSWKGKFDPGRDRIFFKFAFSTAQVECI